MANHDLDEASVDHALAPVGLVGSGTIGGGWAATYLAHGRRVQIVDPDPNAQARLHGFLNTVWPIVHRGIAGSPATVPFHLLDFSAFADLGPVALVHESGPEDIATKRRIYAQLEEVVDATTLIASSSGGLMPSDLQAEMSHPHRFAVAHPFSPVYALPLVEVLAGSATTTDTVDALVGGLRALGKHPIVLRKEVPGYLTNRLTFALLREAVHCLAEGVADAQAIEDAVVYGITPRYLLGGAITSLALAGGPGGMETVMKSFAEPIEGWWSDLGAPHLTPEIQAALVEAAHVVMNGREFESVLADRDRAVVDTLPVLDHLRNERSR
jgi:3-hydroxyacyl-CoA dehydrogenase